MFAGPWRALKPRPIDTEFATSRNNTGALVRMSGMSFGLVLQGWLWLCGSVLCASLGRLDICRPYCSSVASPLEIVSSCFCNVSGHYLVRQGGGGVTQ